MKVAKATFDTLQWGWIADEVNRIIKDIQARRFASCTSLDAGSIAALHSYNTLLVVAMQNLLKRIVRIALLSEINYSPILGQRVVRKTIALDMAECSALHLAGELCVLDRNMEQLIRIASDAMMRH